MVEQEGKSGGQKAPLPITGHAMKIAIVGFGKIARDQHVPAIAVLPGIELAAIASPQGGLHGIPWYETLETLLAHEPDVAAVALCTPPQVRRQQAALALAAGRHVLLEKPPGATVSELNGLADAAQRAGLTVFAAWHSRFAPAVEPARALIATHRVQEVAITWKEDVRVWHPGQSWIWEPGGLGVFDPGINALSILTHLISETLFVTEADLWFPSNRAAPIAAKVTLAGNSGLRVRAEFDFRQTGPQLWDIELQSKAGTFLLSEGGARLSMGGRDLAGGPVREYRGVYQRFLHLIETKACEVDAAPLAHVADAFMLGRRVVVDAFHD